jgi:alkaline phosphatase
MVLTSSVTDATPASFAAHMSDSAHENEIALQLIGDTPLGRTVDLLFGGGLCHFLPEVRGSCRTDGIDVIALAKSRGIDVLDRWDFDRHCSDRLPVMGLFNIHVQPLPATIPGSSEK